MWVLSMHRLIYATICLLSQQGYSPLHSRVLLEFAHNLLKHRIRSWSSSEDSLSLFTCDVTLIPPPGTGVLGCLDNPMEIGSNDIKGEENVEDEGHEKAGHGSELPENWVS